MLLELQALADRITTVALKKYPSDCSLMQLGNARFAPTTKDAVAEGFATVCRDTTRAMGS
jgi:hypothetical protein